MAKKKTELLHCVRACVRGLKVFQMRCDVEPKAKMDE